MSDGFPYRCIAVLGASAGLGRALASALHDLPSQPRVIATARRADRLDELVREKASDRLVARAYDQSVPDAELEQWVADLLRDEPNVDCVVFMAGIQNMEDLADPRSIKDLRADMQMNFFAVVSAISAFTPHFVSLGKAGKPCAIVTGPLPRSTRSLTRSLERSGDRAPAFDGPLLGLQRCDRSAFAADLASRSALVHAEPAS